MARNNQRQAGDTVGSSFAVEGFQIVSDLLPSTDCDAIANVLTEAFDAERRRSPIRIGGVRNLLSTFPLVCETANSPRIVELAGKAAQRDVFPVRAIFFDKTPESNWAVSWHQDLSIAVAERIDVAGFSGWSVKEGVQHVQPSVEILESMVTVRIHLDDCAAANGALRVISGSHRRQKMTGEQIDQWARTEAAFTCEVKKGGALLMSPLLLHSSLPAKNPAHRRVLHIEYAGCKLPGGLKWFEEVVA